jgi:hypothetical protein
MMMAVARQTGKILTRALLLFSLGSVLSALAADAPVEPAAPTATVLAEERIETEFSVHHGVLQMRKGDKDAGRADRQFLSGALRDRNVSLRNCDYHALVSTAKTEPAKDSEKPLSVQRIAVDTLACRTNPTILDYLKQLAGTDFRREAVSFYQHPTTCYDFVANGKLYLLCHYGSAAYTGIDLAPVVAYLKERENE